jgi:hypothetical protein
MPSMPGKSQRIILDKKQGAKPMTTAARLFKKNKRDVL